MLLQREGWAVNHKRVYERLRTSTNFTVEKTWRSGPTRRKKRASHLRVVPVTPTGQVQRWCMDFVTDRLEDGHYFRMLTVLDVFTRECLALHADRHLSGRKDCRA